MLHDFENITYYLHFAENPSDWFSSDEEIGIFVMFVMSAFHPSFVHNLHKPFNRSVEFRGSLCSVSLLAVKT